MKILMCARRFPPDVFSGTETVFDALWQQARRQHEVRLVVGYRQDRSLVPPEAVAVDLRGLSKAKAWTRLAAAIFTEARRWKPDVVLSNSIEVPPTGLPTACIVHDLNFGRVSQGIESRLKRGFYKARARHLGAVITPSGATARALDRIGVPLEAIRVIGNGVDLDATRPSEPPTDPDTVHFVYPSRVLPGKGQHLAVDAIARLPQKHKKRARLTIVGSVHDPVYLDQIRVQAFRQPVEFNLDVPDMVPYYRAADVIVFPTVMEEGFGFTAIEGMANGRPVIWFDQPAVREATGGIGVPVPKGDVTALRDAMVRLMDDSAARLQLGREGRAYCESNLAWSQVWSRYDAVLRAIARPG